MGSADFLIRERITVQTHLHSCRTYSRKRRFGVFADMIRVPLDVIFIAISTSGQRIRETMRKRRLSADHETELLDILRQRKTMAFLVRRTNALSAPDDDRIVRPVFGSLDFLIPTRATAGQGNFVGSVTPPSIRGVSGAGGLERETAKHDVPKMPATRQWRASETPSCANVISKIPAVIAVQRSRDCFRFPLASLRHPPFFPLLSSHRSSFLNACSLTSSRLRVPVRQAPRTVPAESILPRRAQETGTPTRHRSGSGIDGPCSCFSAGPLSIRSVRSNIRL